jgi:hypothetical protein
MEGRSTLLHRVCVIHGLYSTRREIKVRPGHFLRGPLAEKYRPPAARARTLTWDPRLHECFPSPPSSPHVLDSPLHSTPKTIPRHRFFLRQGNSSACQSDNWRRSSYSPTIVGSPPELEKAAPTPPLVEAKFSAPAVETKETASLPDIPAQSSSLPSQVGVIRPVNQPTSRPSKLGSTEEVTVSALPEQGTDTGTSLLVVTECRGSQANQQPEKSTPTTPTSLVAEKENRRPLQDIKISLPVPTLVSRFSYLPTATASAPAIARQAANAPWKDSVRTLIPVNGMIAGAAQEAISPSPLRKRKPSCEPNAQCTANVLPPSVFPVPHRPPRARRSAPHLGKYGNKQQMKVYRAAQTPESSKRRRVRTASAKGVENWNITSAVPAADRKG